MFNPYLRDSTERVTRDPVRKLGWNDRIIGTINLALEAGITPVRFIATARAALDLVQAQQPGCSPESILKEAWVPNVDDPELVQRTIDLLTS